MVTDRCYACPTSVGLSGDKDDRHVCVQCGHVFCSNHGQPFVCNECLARLDPEKQQRVTRITDEDERKFNNGIFILFIGIFLACVGLSSALSSYSGFPAVSIALAVIGLFLFFGGIAMALSHTVSGRSLRSLLPPRVPAAAVSPARQEFFVVESRPARFCMFCGSPLPIDPERRFCPECGKNLIQ
jgi:ribosomal protein S27AE